MYASPSRNAGRRALAGLFTAAMIVGGGSALSMPAANAQESPLGQITGSIGATTQPGADAIAEIVTVAREYSTITYDPNARPTLMGTAEQARRRIAPLVAAADVVKVSDEDPFEG